MKECTCKKTLEVYANMPYTRPILDDSPMTITCKGALFCKVEVLHIMTAFSLEATVRMMVLEQQ